MSYNQFQAIQRVPANPKGKLVAEEDEQSNRFFDNDTTGEDELYTILESQIADTYSTKTYKCQMNDKSEKVGFVKLYNKNQIESEPNGKLKIMRIYRSIYVLQNFQGQSATFVPQFIGKREDPDSIEIITEYVQDNIGEMIEKKHVYCENDAIFLLKCILLNLYEMHHIKNVFNASECYLNVAMHPESILFEPANRLLSDSAKDQIMFSNTGDLYQEEDLKKKNNKEIENIIEMNDYTSPETLKHKRVTMQSNLWSVGCIFYEMLFQEKFIEIDPEVAATKEGMSEYYQQMKYSSETLRSTLICKSTNISTFSIVCLQGLLAFHEKDRYTWEDVKKNIFSLDLTKSIENYDLKSLNHSYVSNNSAWTSRSRTPCGKGNSTSSAKKWAHDTSNVYMSFTDNSVILEHANEENDKKSKNINKSQIKNNAAGNKNNNFLTVSYNYNNNKSQIEDDDNFLKQSFMNGVMKKSLFNGNPSNENSFIDYMKKGQKNELNKSSTSSNQVINMLQSFSINGFENNNIRENHQLNQNNSFTEDFLEEEEETPQLNYQGDKSNGQKEKSFTKSGVNKSNLLGKSDLNKSNLSYTNSNNVVSYNISNNTNNFTNQLNNNNLNQLAKSNASDRSSIYKYQLQMPKYSDMQEEIKKSKNVSKNSKIENIENHSKLSDNKSLFKHIEQHKQDQQKKYSPLLDQYESTQKSEEANTIEQSGELTGFDFLDKLMAQRDSFNPDVDFNSNRSDLSSNTSNVKQIPLANPRNMVNHTKNNSSNGQTQKIQTNQQAMSINDLSHSPYHQNTVKMNSNNNDNLNASSLKGLQMQNPNAAKSKVISESRNDQSQNNRSQNISKSNNHKDNQNLPQIVYSVVPTPTQSQINHQIAAAGGDQIVSNPSTQREGNGLQEVHSKYINASDLKSRLEQFSQNNCDKSGRYIFDEEPIEGIDISRNENLQTPQQRYMIFDELVSNDELACSYMLNTKMRTRMGLDLNHLQKAFSSDNQQQHEVYGEAQHEVQGNQSFTSAVGYEKSVYYDKNKQMVVQKERKSSLIRSQTVKAVNPPLYVLKDTILKDQYKPFSKNDELFVFSSFLDPFEFKIQGYFQIVLQKTEEIFKHFNNEECLNCVIVVLSLFRVRLFHLIFKQLAESAKKNSDSRKSLKSNQSTEDDENYEQLTQSIKQEMKDKVTQDKNIKHLDELILQFLKRSTLEKTKDLIEPHIYGVYRKHLFNFYNFLSKKIYDSSVESKKELKLPYDRLIQMSRLSYHILVLSHYQKVFKLYFKELFTQKQNSSVSNLFQFIEDRISFMDLYQLQNEKNALKQFLNIKQTQALALPHSTSPINKNNHTMCLLPPQPHNTMGALTKQTILI